MTGFDLFMNSKRGQQSSTSQAAVLVLVIGLLIVAYLILLPKDAREDVLKGEDIDFDDFGNGNGDDTTVDKNDEGSELLLLRNPGNLVPSGIDDVEKEFASVHLFDRLEVETQNLADRVAASRSLFRNGYEDLEFVIENEENLEKLSLFFNVVNSQGSVEISLNGETVFEGALASGDVPIQLPVVNIGSRNLLRIMGADVGWAILSKNEVELKDLELIQEFSLENKAELRTFEVSRAEAVDKAEMSFFVNCLEIKGDQGVLKIYLNRRNVFFGKVVCDASQVSEDLSEDFFVDGTNFLTFEVDKGNYIVESISLDYEFDEGFQPLYFFTIDEKDFEDVLDEDRKVKLIMRFKDDNSRKRADVQINDDTIFVDVNSGIFEKDITELSKEGENFIKIFAKNEFELIQVEVRLEKD